MKRTKPHQTITSYFSKKKKEIEPDLARSSIELGQKEQEVEELEVDKEQESTTLTTDSEPKPHIDPGPSTSQLHHHERLVTLTLFSPCC